MNDRAERVVRLQGVSKSYGPVRAVQGIDVEIRRGETVAFLGPNGAGKTTTISMLLGLALATSGTIEVFGRSPAEAIRQSQIGAMLQEGKLLPGAQVGELLDVGQVGVGDRQAAQGHGHHRPLRRPVVQDHLAAQRAQGDAG